MKKRNPKITKYDLYSQLSSLLEINLSEKEKSLFDNIRQLKRSTIDNLLTDIANELNDLQSENIDKYGKSKLVQRGNNIAIQYGKAIITTPVVYSESLVSQIQPMTILEIDRYLKDAYSRGVTSDLKKNIEQQAVSLLLRKSREIDPLSVIDFDISTQESLLGKVSTDKQKKQIQSKLKGLLDMKKQSEQQVEVELDNVQNVLKDLVPIAERKSYFISKNIKDLSQKEQYDRQQTFEAISNLNIELIDLYAKQMDWEKNKLIEKRDILDWLETYGIVNNGYGKEITWDFVKLPYGLSEYIKKKNKSIIAKRNRNKKKSFTSIEPRYNDIVRAIRKGKADRNKDHKFVSTTHAFKMMGGLAKWGSYGEGLTLNKLIDKKDRIEGYRKLSDIQRRELDYEIGKINSYTPKRANPNNNWIQGAFKEIDDKGTEGAFTRYCKEEFGATTVKQRIKCAKTIKRKYEQGIGNYSKKTYRRAIFYLNIVKASRKNPIVHSNLPKKPIYPPKQKDKHGKTLEFSPLNQRTFTEKILTDLSEKEKQLYNGLSHYHICPVIKKREKKCSAFFPQIEKIITEADALIPKEMVNKKTSTLEWLIDQINNLIGTMPRLDTNLKTILVDDKKVEVLKEYFKLTDIRRIQTTMSRSDYPRLITESVKDVIALTQLVTFLPVKPKISINTRISMTYRLQYGKFDENEKKDYWFFQTRLDRLDYNFGLSGSPKWIYTKVDENSAKNILREFFSYLYIVAEHELARLEKKEKEEKARIERERKAEEERKTQVPQHVIQREEKLNRYFKDEKPFYLLVGDYLDRLESDYSSADYKDPIDFLNDNKGKFKILKIDTTSSNKFPYGKIIAERLSHGDIGEKINMSLVSVYDYINLAEKFIEKVSKTQDKNIKNSLLMPSLRHLIQEVEPNVFETTTDFKGKASKPIKLQLIYDYDKDRFRIKLIDDERLSKEDFKLFKSYLGMPWSRRDQEFSSGNKKKLNYLRDFESEVLGLTTYDDFRSMPAWKKQQSKSEEDKELYRNLEIAHQRRSKEDKLIKEIQQLTMTQRYDDSLETLYENLRQQGGGKNTIDYIKQSNAQNFSAERRGKSGITMKFKHDYSSKSNIDLRDTIYLDADITKLRGEDTWFLSYTIFDKDLNIIEQGKTTSIDEINKDLAMVLVDDFFHHFDKIADEYFAQKEILSDLNVDTERVLQKQFVKALYFYNNEEDNLENASYDFVMRQLEDKLKDKFAFLQYKIPIKYKGQKGFVKITKGGYKGTPLDKIIAYSQKEPKPKRVPSSKKLVSVSMRLDLSVEKSEEVPQRVWSIFNPKTDYGGIFNGWKEMEFYDESSQKTIISTNPLLGSQGYRTICRRAFDNQSKGLHYAFREMLGNFKPHKQLLDTKQIINFEKRIFVITGNVDNKFLKFLNFRYNVLDDKNLSDEDMIQKMREEYGYVPFTIANSFSQSWYERYLSYRSKFKVPYEFPPVAISVDFKSLEIEIDFEELLLKTKLPVDYLYKVDDYR